jgi:hypothetical protein
VGRAGPVYREKPDKNPIERTGKYRGFTGGLVSQLCGGLHLEQGVFPASLAALTVVLIADFLRNRQPASWYLVPVLVM